jgi:tetratricopeptide (TPR) repeat protein
MIPARAVIPSLLLVLLFSACGGVDRSQLEEIPRPDLERFGEAIREHLESERQAFDTTLEEAGDAELAAATGRMGQLYQAYGLSEPAAVAYRNALLLDPEEPRWHYLLGVQAQLRGDPEAALAHFGAVLEAHPENLPTLLRAAEMHLAAGRGEEAEALFERVHALAPENAAAHFGLGRGAAARGEHEKAVAAFERALELQPKAKNVHYLLGLSLQRLGRRDEAEAHLAAMDSADVVFDDPWMEEVEGMVEGIGPVLDRAINAYGARRYDEAIAAYSEALGFEPQNATAMRGLGFTLHEAGRLEESAIALRRMVEVYPEHRLARLELATVLMELERFEEAEAEFLHLLEKEPDFEQAQFNLGTTLARMERWEEAAKRFRKVLELDERDQEARYHLAVAYDALGRGEESLALLRQVVGEAPGHVKSRQRLGLELFNRGDLEGAAEQHRAVVALEDAPEQEKALALYQLGRIAKGAGRPAEALEHYRRAAEKFPDLWQAWLALANTHRDAGDLEQAAEAYRRAVEASPGNALARLSEVETLLALSRHGAVRQRLEEGLGAIPRSAELAHLLARHLVTAPTADLRDAPRGLELARNLFDALPTLEHARTVAMALAEAGRFQEAVEWQERLIARAEKEGAGNLAELRQELESYRAGVPIRLP